MAENPSSLKSNRLGIGMHSYAFHWSAARSGNARTRFKSAFEFLEYCCGLGAGGVQVGLGILPTAEAKRFRARAESGGVFLEGQTSLPREAADVPRFEAEVATVAACGANVMRSALLSGRRYETFDSQKAFQEFASKAWTALKLSEPIAKKHRVRLAIENHKDWLAAEFVDLLRRISSEYVGVCVDVGNNISLLEDPVEVVETLAPFAVSSHLKDMGVQEYADGFFLSEVPLGQGILDLPRLVATLKRANPAIRLNLEMMTRDPLPIPCLTEKYWATMPTVPARRLALALAMVKANPPRQPLPRMTGKTPDEQLQFEDENVRRCLAHARENLQL